MKHSASTTDYRIALAALDRGEFGSALRRFERDEPTDDPDHRRYRGALLLHLDRVDECRAELEGLTDPATLAILGEADLWDGNLQAAEDAAEMLAELPETRPRAMVLLARCAVRRGDWGEALERIERARHAVGEHAYLQAILDHSEAYARAKTEADPTIDSLFARAIAVFEAVDDRRWQAISRCLRGAWLAGLGRHDEAARELERSIAAARSISVLREAAWSEHNLSQVFLATGRASEAIRILEHLLKWERAGRFAVAECNGLVSLAYALTIEGRISDGKRAAEGALALSEMIDAADLRLDAALVAAWVHARTGDAGALSRLRQLRRASQYEGGTEEQRYRAALFLADAVLDSIPDEAVALWDEAERSPEARAGATYGGLLRFVRQRMDAAMIRFDAFGVLQIDVRHGFPSLAAALEIVERFLVHEATLAAPTQLEAGQKLGLNKQRIGDKLARYGKPTRERIARPLRK